MEKRSTITLKNAGTKLKSSAAPIATRRARTGGIRSAAQSVWDFFRSAKSYYQAATTSRRMRLPMDVGPNSYNSEIAVIRARSRYAKANHSFYKQAIRQIANNVVGYGIRPVIADPALEKLWNRWVPEADARGHFGFYGLQWHGVDAVATDGGVMFRFRERKPGDMRSGVPLQLQIMEEDHLPLGYTQQTANGNFIQDGVERDAIERVTRYHIYPRHPLDWKGIANPLTPVPVDAADICYVFLPERPTSERGVPWGASVLNTNEFLEDYLQAEGAKKAIQAKYTTFYTRPINEEQGFAGDSEAELEFANPEIGSAVEVPEGYDVKFAEMPGTDGNFESYNRVTLSKIAVALGLCFEMITLDFSKITDRSYRAMMLQVGKFIDSVVYHLVVSFLDKVWRRWLSAAVLAGAWTVPEGKDIEDYMNIEWMPPPRGHVHPVQEIQALVEAVQAGLISRQQATAEMGLNALEIDLQNKQDSDRTSTMGLFYSVFSGWQEKAAKASISANVDAVGQAIRAGLVTPTMEDEDSLRKSFGLPEMSAALRDAWQKNPIRQPITLSKPADLAPEPDPVAGSDGKVLEAAGA